MSCGREVATNAFGEVAQNACLRARRCCLLDSVAGRLKEGGEEANALAKDLRGQLARTDIDSVARCELRDILALAGGKVVSSQPGDARRVA